MKKLLYCLLPLLYLTACQSDPESSAPSTAEQLDSLMSYSHENGLFNGTVLVSKNNDVIYRKAFGYADFEKGEELMPESDFYLASVSKQFTTMAIMILKERGELSYEDKLSKFFPDYPSYADSITIRHMMTHTSGIPDHYRLNAYKPGLSNQDVYELLVRQEQLDFKPGSQEAYSNGAYVLLSMIVEEVAGPFHEFMKDNIFDPLGMDHSLVYDHSEPQVPNRAIGHNAIGDKDDYEIFTTGAGGIYSNVDDLYKWDQALQANKLVSRETLMEAYQPYILSSGDTSYYGFGWSLDPGRNWVGHSGSLSGFRTYLRRYPDKGDAFVLLTNMGRSFAMGQINDGLEQILKNQAFKLPLIPLSAKIRELAVTEGIDRAVSQAKKMFDEDREAIEYDEYGINALGYAYLGKGKMNHALQVFRLNTELRPNAGNTYDSYGEALLANQDTLGAIEQYSISVKKNPNNQNAIKVLKELGVNVDKLLSPVPMSKEQLETYVGSYELEVDFMLEIIREGNRLFIHPTGQEKSELFASETHRFYSKIVDAQITFNQDDSGEIKSLTLHQNGDYHALKIE